MINLLPPDVKQNIVFARRNSKLRNWTVALVFCAISILAIVAIGHLYLRQSINDYSVRVEKGKEELKIQKIDDTQKRVQELTTSLKLVTQVLQREILFSSLLAQIGRVSPNGSVLTSLSINKLQGGLDLQAAAVDYHTATQVQVNLQDPKNKIFDKADIVSVQCASIKAGGDAFKNQYPCTIQLRALFAKNNSFTLLNPGEVKQ